MSRILITGCSKGLGKSTALELVRRGNEVVATARKPETLSELPVAARLALDVTDDTSVRHTAAEAGAVDVLVNNAAEIADKAFDAFLRSAMQIDWSAGEPELSD